jgi:hypothetical protein
MCLPVAPYQAGIGNRDTHMAGTDDSDLGGTSRGDRHGVHSLVVSLASGYITLSVSKAQRIARNGPGADSARSNLDSAPFGWEHRYGGSVCDSAIRLRPAEARYG